MNRRCAIFLAALLPTTAIAQELRPPSREAENYFARQEWQQCAEYFTAALRSGADYSSIPFGAAFCYARLGDRKQALENLSLAIARGFRGVDYLRGDPAFTAMSSGAQWSNLVAACQRNADSYAASLNPELLRLFEADQADRRPPIDEAAAMIRDESRRLRVLALIGTPAIHSAGDYFHAAFLLQHSCLSQDYATAHQLALRASELDPGDGGKRWLVAATQDRYLSSLGKPQIYGTQYRPIDPSVISDTERLRMCVRPIRETIEALDRVFHTGGS